jgi:hypothetical protein
VKLLTFDLDDNDVCLNNNNVWIINGMINAEYNGVEELRYNGKGYNTFFRRIEM